jgi:pyrroloquinoline-quinone synthase
MTEPPWIRCKGEAFREELNRYKLANHPFRHHPFFQAIEAGTAPLETIYRWAGQFYPWLACVPSAYAERFARCPTEPQFVHFRNLILDQLVEEAGDPHGKTVGHPELWIQFCEGIGLPRAKLLAAPRFPSTMVAIDDFLYLNREVPFYISAAGSSEPPNVDLCSRLLPAWRSKYHVPEAALTYYTLHVTADVEHTKFVNEMVGAFASTPEIRRQMWDAMLRGFALHRLLIDGAVGEGYQPPPP